MSQSQELGPFIVIGNQFRVRQSSISAYRQIMNDKITEEFGKYVIAIWMNGNSAIYPIVLTSQEDIDIELARLDWIFNKQYQGWE